MSRILDNFLRTMQAAPYLATTLAAICCTEGALWVALSDRLVKLAGASALIGNVSPTPAVVLSRPVFPDLASKIVLRPTPPGLPLY